MNRFLRSAALAAVFVLGASVVAAAAPTTVTVALLDSSIMGQGPGGQGAGPRGNGAGTGMMGQGRGTGMMGGGYGRGMMNGGGYGGRGMGQGMMAIRADRRTVEAGPVTFDVTNRSTGLIHEMLVVAVANADVTAPL